jgi:hypothetical protein
MALVPERREILTDTTGHDRLATQQRHTVGDVAGRTTEVHDLLDAHEGALDLLLVVSDGHSLVVVLRAVHNVIEGQGAENQRLALYLAVYHDPSIQE